MKIPTTKEQLERLIAKAGSRRAARIKLDMSVTGFYNLIHRLGLKIDPKWAAFGKLAADGAKRDRQEESKPAKKTTKSKKVKA